MKRLAHILGVTLLEIMLVLAIAALIIVMSVRYFQSASTSQQATAFISQLQAISAAANSMSKGNANFTGLSASSLSGIIPSDGLTPPWGGGTPLTVTGAQGSFTVTIPGMPTGVCSLVRGQLVTTSGNWAIAAPCATATYTAIPPGTT